MNKQAILLTCALILIFGACQNPQEPDSVGYTPVSYKNVTITDVFWKAKIDSNHQNGIPGCFESCDHSLVNFDIAAGISDAERQGTEASDSDVYKIIQGAAHALDHNPDPQLELYVDSLIDRIAAAQEEDGYLDTYWSIKDLSRRWTMIETRHELYCAGHFFEAAVAYYEVTGKRKILDMAIRLADHIDSVFGKGKLENIPGHQEIELALFKLYETTGEERYFKLAEFFLEERGNPERLAYRASLGDKDPNFGIPARWLKPSYRQDHIPVKDQRKATGHAVRASYMFSGMADYARLSGSDEYMPALNALWNDIVTKKIYVTGSIGTAEFHDEGFGSEYSLPTASAYCETCSAIALMFWNHRMAALTGDATFSDLFELTLFNGGISGGSASGDLFFYTNPLEGTHTNKRKPWYEPGCCPSNYVRFIPQIDQYIYGQTENSIVVNQFIGSELNTTINGADFVMEQKTKYPWNGSVELIMEKTSKARFNLRIRIPGWVKDDFYPGGLYEYVENNLNRAYSISVNDKSIEPEVDSNGYLNINRKWKPGDQVNLNFNMPVRLVKGRDEIKDVEGQNVLTRGPVIFCLEDIDNSEIFSDPNNYNYTYEKLKITAEDQITKGILSIHGEMQNKETNEKAQFIAYPYFSWRNRGPSAMRVWF